MCGGFSYQPKEAKTGHETPKKIYFPIPYAQIPILSGDGDIRMVQWGKRKGEDEEFDVPQTGWARIESLVAHKWDKYHPSRVRIPALSWMEKDPARDSHWFDLQPDQYLLGVKIEVPEKAFVYVVTKPATEWFKPIHDREPMVVGPEQS